MAVTNDQVQALYIAYFNRPADFLGLSFQVNVANQTSLKTVADQFAKSPEYTALFTGKSTAEVIDTIYMNLFGRHAEPAGIKFWGDLLNNPTSGVTIGNAALTIFNGALNDDKVAVTNKVAAATAFYNALDTSAEIVGYSGDAANAVAKVWMSGITTNASLAAATTPAALDALTASIIVAHDAAANVGVTYNLTLGVDTLTGGAGNDTFIANDDVASSVGTITGLDTIDGGAGNDTLLVSTATGGTIDLTKLTMSNVESLKLVSVGDIGTAGTTVNTSGFSGLTSETVTAAVTATTTFQGATGTTLTLTNGTANGITTKGFGGAMTITTGAGAVKVGDVAAASSDANAVTSVTVKGGSTVDITDNSGSSGAVGSKLTTVSLDGETGAATLTGNGLTNVTLKNGVAASDVTIANTSAHALNLTLNKEATGVVVTDGNATSVAISVTGTKSQIALAAAKATTVSVSGSVDLALDTTGSDYTKLATVTVNSSGKFTADLSAAAVLTSVTSTGSGAVNVTIAGTNAASTPAAQSVTTGAGNDTVTLTGTLGTGSTLSLGDGSDTVGVTGGGVITSGAVVDAGAGTDTLLLSIVGSANVGAFKNFENFDVKGATANFDSSILAANNTVTNFVGSGAAGAAITLSNLASGVGFIVNADMGATVVTLNQTTAGAMTITSNFDETSSNSAANTSAASFVTNATSVKAVFDNNNVDALGDGYANTAALSVSTAAATTATVVSGGTEVVNTATLTDTGAKLTSVVVTGTQALVLDLGAASAAKMTSVDASGQTAGGLTFNLNDLAATGTLKLGAGNDIVTLNAAGTFTAATDVQHISGFGLGTVEDATAQKGFDVLVFAGATQAADHTAVGTGYAIKDGLYTFGGAGPSTLAAAVIDANSHLAANEATVFQYAGNYYVYAQGATTATTDDQIVQLVGATGVHGLDNIAAGTLYVF